MLNGQIKGIAQRDVHISDRDASVGPQHLPDLARLDPAPFEHGCQGVADLPMNRRRCYQVDPTRQLDKCRTLRLTCEHGYDYRCVYDKIHLALPH